MLVTGNGDSRVGANEISNLVEDALNRVIANNIDDGVYHITLADPFLEDLLQNNQVRNNIEENFFILSIQTFNIIPE